MVVVRFETKAIQVIQEVQSRQKGQAALAFVTLKGPWGIEFIFK